MHLTVGIFVDRSAILIIPRIVTNFSPGLFSDKRFCAGYCDALKVDLERKQLTELS